MNLFLAFFVIASVSATQFKYNTRYCLSKPHYLVNKNYETVYQPKPIEFKQTNEIDYEIPKWVYKRVFKKNKPNYYKE